MEEEIYGMEFGYREGGDGIELVLSGNTIGTMDRKEWFDFLLRCVDNMRRTYSIEVYR